MLLSSLPAPVSNHARAAWFWFLLMVLMGGTPVPLQAADGTITIHERTFNKFAQKIERNAAGDPLIKITGNYKFRVTIDYWIGKHTITICDSTYRATVTGLVFHITSSGITVDGNVNATWCGVSFATSQLDTSGDIYFNQPDKTVRVALSAASVRPCFRYSGYNVCLPTSINVAPSLNVPPVSVGMAFISYETAGGTRSMRMVPYNTTLVKRSGCTVIDDEEKGCIELRSNVNLW